MFTYSICYSEVRIHLFEWGGEDEFSAWTGVARGVFSTEKEVFRGLNFSGKILRWGDLPEFLYEISFYFLLSLHRFNFTCGDVKCNFPGQIFARVE